jgi:hypothetical protein
MRTLAWPLWSGALAVSDEEVSHLRVGSAAALGVDLVIAAGDLSFEYLGALIDLVDRPGVFVPGNHDPDVSGFSKHASLSLRAGMPKDHWLNRVGPGRRCVNHNRSASPWSSARMAMTLAPAGI